MWLSQTSRLIYDGYLMRGHTWRAGVQTVVLGVTVMLHGHIRKGVLTLKTFKLYTNDRYISYTSLYRSLSEQQQQKPWTRGTV